MIFAEQLNLKGLAKGMLGKHCLDDGWGGFLQILEQCCFKRGVYFQKVDPKNPPASSRGEFQSTLLR